MRVIGNNQIARLAGLRVDIRLQFQDPQRRFEVVHFPGRIQHLDLFQPGAFIQSEAAVSQWKCLVDRRVPQCKPHIGIVILQIREFGQNLAKQNRLQPGIFYLHSQHGQMAARKKFKSFGVFHVHIKIDFTDAVFNRSQVIFFAGNVKCDREVLPEAVAYAIIADKPAADISPGIFKKIQQKTGHLHKGHPLFSGSGGFNAGCRFNSSRSSFKR